MTQVYLGNDLGVDVTVQLQQIGEQLYLVIMKPSGQERIELDVLDVIESVR